MRNIDILHEIAALAGYTIDSSTGQDVTNKARALRRLNIVKADIISRFGGRWPAQFREGWLPLKPLYTEGTIAVTNGSNTVTGTNTTWNSVDGIQAGYKILLPDASWYKIVSVVSDTQIILSQPFQGTTVSGNTYEIWKDEYTLYPEVHSVGGFVNYNLQSTMDESYIRNMKQSYPVPSYPEEPNIYSTIGRAAPKFYSTGTVSGTINTNTLTGAGTLWLTGSTPVEPGWEILIGSTYYHVKAVYSDTSIELYQLLTSTISGSSYSATGKNAIKIRFREPTNQRIVSYWYYAKSYPLVNDNDEDWVCELYPEVINLGAVVKDYLDKNDVARANMSKMTFESAVKDMKVSEEGAMTGVRTLGYDIPPAARD